MTRDIGVAITVPDPYAREIQVWRDRLGDPQARLVVPHITLLPPTPVPDRDWPAVEQHLAAVAAGARPFEVHLAGSDTFRPVSAVVFVQVRQGAEQCRELQRAVRQGPLQRPLKFDYHPHVTLAHDVGDTELDRGLAELAGFDGRFTARALTLFDRVGTAWQACRDFAFTG